MTDQERGLIENLIHRIRSAPPPRIDREADDLIGRGIGSNPDALYILVQSVLLQEMALNRANAQIEQLRGQQPGGSSFLGDPAGQAGGYRSSAYRQDAVPPPPPPPPQQYAPAQYIPEPPRSRFSDFLHNAAQTAAGVVAGEVAFSAISSIFGHRGGYEGYGGYGQGQGFLGGGGGETIVNNYYEGGNAHPLEPGLSPDLEDRRFSGQGDSGDSAADTFADDSSGDDTYSDDTDSDDASDDNASSDDGSSDDGSSDV